MAWWFAALLGLVQGLTEFIPVSSTAHLRILPPLLGQPDVGVAYSAVIQLGTLVAVLIYFARDVFIDMPRAMLFDRGSAQAKLPWYLIAGTLPIVIAGLTLKDYVRGPARSLYVVSGALILVGVLMVWVERQESKDRVMLDLAWADALMIGLAQACALVPGVSRSGATILVALLLGMRRSEAARFSFLLGIPAIAGAGIYEMRDAVEALGSESWMAIIVGCAAAAVSGYASIAWLLRYVSHHKLSVFGWYRIAVGGIVLGLVLAGALAA